MRTDILTRRNEVSNARHDERRVKVLTRRSLHPEVDWSNPLSFTADGYNVHPKQVGVRYFPRFDCPCACGERCPVHDPVEAEGDWDA